MSFNPGSTRLFFLPSSVACENVFTFASAKDADFSVPIFTKSRTFKATCDNAINRFSPMWGNKFENYNS